MISSPPPWSALSLPGKGRQSSFRKYSSVAAFPFYPTLSAGIEWNGNSRDALQIPRGGNVVLDSHNLIRPGCLIGVLPCVLRSAPVRFAYRVHDLTEILVSVA